MEKTLGEIKNFSGVFWDLKNKSISINDFSTLNWVTSCFGFFLTMIKFPLIFWLLLSLSHPSEHSRSIFLILIIMVLDILDGEIFKLSSFSKTHWGGYRRVVDAVGDRIAILSVFTFLLIDYAIPFIIFAVIISKETILATVTIKPFLKKKIVLKANIYSKLATTLIGFTAIFLLIGHDMLSFFCLVLMVPLVYFSYRGYDKINKMK